MSIERVLSFLEQKGMADRVITFEASTATVELAAQALGVAPGHIAKTMSFHKKGRMIPFDQVESLVGHAPGGVCPFAIKEGVPVYLDESLHRFETVYPAAGNDHSAVRLTPEELFRIIPAEGWVDIAKR